MSPDQPLVLVVDDNDGGRFAKCETLRRAGYRLIDAATGSDAISLALSEHPDLVLLDVNLPDMSGLEVCRVIKTAAVPRPMQVMQLSSTAITEADRVKGLTGGADAYLTEPVPSAVLVATVAAMLRAGAAERAASDALVRERHAREEAEEANRLKDDFLAALSHELRTPLSAMVGWIWQLRHGDDDPTKRRRALDGLERSTAIQVRLINDLLDVSRIGKGKVDLQVSAVRMSAVIDAAVEGVQAAARARSISIEVRCDDVTVRGDASRLQQVLANLLTNAIQFSHDGGRIEVSCEMTGEWARLRVRDHGVGIVPTLLPHIFEPFRQGEGGFARRHGGLGLGLAIVRQLVQLHGGHTMVESDGLGLGTTFTVTLPRQPAGTAQPTPSHPTQRRLLDGLRVLVVEDDEDSRGWLLTLLGSEGASVVTASTAREALAAAATQPLDLIVSDIGLPGQDGLQLLKALRELGHRMPAVALTAFCTPEERSRILAAGFERHFGKPPDTDEFLASLATIAAANSSPH
jgi:signal transduction histidine kinase